jgi:hypothetical protein
MFGHPANVASAVTSLSCLRLSCTLWQWFIDHKKQQNKKKNIYIIVILQQNTHWKRT